MKKTLIITWIGVLIDTFCTLYLVNCGFMELNPAMRWLLRWPWLFILVKVGTMALASYIYWLGREMKIAIVMSRLVCAYYTAIAIYYAFFLLAII